MDAETIYIDQVWYTVVTDVDGFLTIRRAKTPKEEISAHFEDLKKDLVGQLQEMWLEFSAHGLTDEAHHVALNIQGLSQLKESDVGFLKTLNTRCLH